VPLKIMLLRSAESGLFGNMKEQLTSGQDPRAIYKKATAA
jgi:hypothetical protein